MDSDDTPIAPDEFAARMNALGLDAGAGRVAVAVSGGADSLALSLLAAEWGEVVALTVDHRLRPDSTAEAMQVRDWLAARGIAHRVLTREGEKPETGLQAAARTARYKLLEGWCREAGIEALLLGHHRDDQAETLLLRLARGSGVWGLAAMAPVSGPVSAPDLGIPRRYRPLLDFPKSRLEATCRAMGQSWIEDPSNRDPAHARTKTRAMLADPPLAGLTPDRLADTARRLGRARAALDHYVSDFLARHVRIDEAGFAELDRAALQDAPEEIGLRVLERLLSAIGGLAGPPRGERIERAYERVRRTDFAGLTTLGCQLLPAAGAAIVICREPVAVADEAWLAPCGTIRWDGRFRVESRTERPVRIAALGEAGWRRLSGQLAQARAAAIPAQAGACLPGIRDEQGRFAVPSLGLGDPALAVDVRFLPPAAPPRPGFSGLGS